MVTTMTDYILFMHADASSDHGDRSQQWAAYFTKLREAGAFQGGSAIGDGICTSKSNAPPPITAHLAGYIRIRATDLDHARQLLTGNPAYEAGGTVEIRELPRD
jgi:hypothetical protein